MKLIKTFFHVNLFLISTFLFVLHVPSAKASGGRGTQPSLATTQLDFKKVKIKFSGKTLTVELADDYDKRERGLMFREHLADNHGMLFVFESAQSLSFWMKNTLIPLSIGYFDSDRKLMETYEMEPAVMGEKRPKTYPSHHPARYALEMPKGWFAKNKVKPGATFTFVD